MLAHFGQRNSNIGRTVGAAHCFWNKEEVLQPASRYAVAAGKILRHWNEQRDAVAQKSDVAEIRISPKFRGSLNDFKDDIALLVLTTPLVFDAFVSPVCVDFDVEFDEQQLTDGSFGKIASWSPKDEKDRTPSVLQVGWLPYVSRDKCVADTPSFFRAYITSDKICAGDEIVHELINLRRSTLALSDSLLIPLSKARMQRVPVVSSESAVGLFVLARSTTGQMALEV
ncbi:Coagulation factor IX [Eumeta japonica]|uniref:Coagulation factor IX n=1 Tax=Eumeta variegata TaxID=151549 RepID=A0A4C1UXA9_EUMVA|nr:Coagulation factor IX [Eumeta japonica]